MTAEAGPQFSFRTRSNYTRAFILAVQHRHGANWLESVSAGVQLRIQRKELPAAVRSMLLSAWNTEQLLLLTQAIPELALPAAQWAPVQAYYAVHSMSRAWLMAKGFHVSDNHRGQLNILSEQLSNSSTIPYPLNFSIGSLSHAHEGGRVAIVRPSWHVPTESDYSSFIIRGLRYARNRQVDHDREQELRRTKRKRLPTGGRARLDKKIPPTTVVHLLWEMRRSANYDDPEDFISGGLSVVDPPRFLADLAELVAFVNFAFECHLAHLVGADALVRATRRLATSRTIAEHGPLARSEYWPRV